MNVAIDTSSLLSLVRYYLPFDKNNILHGYIKERIESKDILILDKVYEESKYTAKGIITSKLDYLKDKKHIIKTDDLLPDQKFFNQLENQFINKSVRNKLSDVEFENRKNDYLELADAKLLLYSLKHREDNIVIVSEETDSSNDNKSFKKLPAICKILKLDILTLPQLLDQYKEIDFEFK